MKNFKRSKTILEFDKILLHVAAIARTDGAKAKILEITPSDDAYTVRQELAKTAKAREMIVVKSMPPFGSCRDIIPSVDRAVKNATLTTRELLDIASLLRSVSSVKRYPGIKEELGALEPFFAALSEITSLERQINDSIPAEDMIADTASDALYRIRRDMRKCESGIRDVLAKYTSGAFSKYLQENIVTMRNGRYVVPVKADAKNEIKGLVHDTSSSGATLFIEPLAVLEENNKLRELKSKEKNEIERILSELSQNVGSHAATIIIDYNALTDLAVIFAKAEYSYQINAFAPVINEKDNLIRLKSARHPLLDKNKVVPISLSFGGKNKVLVITGPNTGGKTVTLKTIGLFALMTQSGFEIPCDEGSIMPIFDEVLPDIGDEQSIEQSLSTFSAHMVNIVGIINDATSRSLCLFDELGAGTDPTEGAALAVSILEEMKNRGAVIAATTHYAEIKTYALDTEGVINASCEFDVETLRPTYRLIVGLPGKSNAFAISLRLGIPERIIEKAKCAVSEDNARFEDILNRLEDTESRLSKEKRRADELKKQAEESLEEAKQIKEKAKIDAEKALEKAEEQARRLVASAKASSDFIFGELYEMKRKAEKEKNFSSMDEVRKAIRTQLDKVEPSEPEEEESYTPPRPFKIGDDIIIAGINKSGYIITLDEKNATVQAGIIKTKVKICDLRLALEKKDEIKKSSSTFTKATPVTKPEIDVRGQTGDDAYFMIDRYFESAKMSNYHVVTIIHGKGTGALRSAIWKQLKQDKRVAAFRSGRYGEGDMGVTIVELK